MSGFNLYIELQDKMNLLDKALSSYRKRGTDFAQARHDYQVSLAQEMLRQRVEGMPVTIVSDICKGLEHIADLRLKKDIAESLYKAAAEAINCYKIEIRVIESQIDREFRG